MPEPPKDNNAPRPIRPEGSHRADGSDLDRLWKERARQGLTQGEVEMRKVLESLAGNKEIQLGPRGSTTEAGHSLPLGPRGKYQYDAYNTTEEPTTEEPEAISFNPEVFSGTPYGAEAKLLETLAQNRDWEGIQHLKERLLDKLGSDETTADQGKLLYRFVSSALQEYIDSQGEQRRLRQTDPRAHFGPERLELMLEDSPEGDEAREEEFNALFSRADTQPSRPFQEVFNSFYDEPIYNAFIENLQKNGEKLFAQGKKENNQAIKGRGEKLLDSAQRYILEYTYRGLIHDANYLIVANLGVEQMSGFMGRFSTEMLDDAFRKKGVTPAMHFYEQALMKVKAENNGYLPYNEVVANNNANNKTGERYSRVETLARKYFNEALSAGFLKDSKGNVIEPGSMRDWEIDRSMAFARGLGIITGRFVEIAATSRLPENQFISMWAHVLIGEIAPFRHAIGKFFIGNARNRFLLYQLDKNRKSWSMDELKEFDVPDKGNKRLFEVINGLVPKEEQRLLGKVNPFEVGGILTRSRWRIDGDPEAEQEEGRITSDTQASSIGKIVEDAREKRKGLTEGQKLQDKDDPFEHIGKGVLIEKYRWDLNKKGPKGKRAEDMVRKELREVAKLLPTKLIFSIGEARKAIEGRFGTDAFSREDFRNALDALIVVQERAIVNESDALDFNIPSMNNADLAMAKEIADCIKESYLGPSGNQDTPLLNTLFDDFKDRKWEIPYVFGTEDVPWDKYEFVRTGGRSVDRRWKDMLAASKAGAAVGEMVNAMPQVKSAGDLVNLIHKVHSSIEQYDADIAEDVAADLAEGVIWFYSKDSYAKGVFGEALSKLPGNRSSYAEFAFGRGAMAWDELTTHDFINGLRERHMINDRIKSELMEKTKSKGINVALRLGEYAAFIILLAILIRSTNEAFKGSMRPGA